MILNENLVFMKKKYPEIMTFINSMEGQIERDSFQLVASRNGLPTLQIDTDGTKVYLHSKYDPMIEAQQWIQPYEETIADYDHVFFYGIGLGYHIDYLMNRYPNKTFTLYEPSLAIFYQYLCAQSMNKLPLKNMKHLFVEMVPAFMKMSLEHFINDFKEEVLIISHPVYERIYSKQVNDFSDMFKKVILTARNSLTTTAGYQQLWTSNSVYNFTRVLDTPNILREKKSYFKGKPVMMVSAGPSLEDEIENIRQIKEKRLAYIFAVGSANKALLSHNISPDAVLSYDPNAYNHLVFEEIITQERKDIPLIFGSTVGYKTVQFYPGPMLHMVTNQDSLSAYYLSGEHLAENGEIVSDAPSIAVLTIELLYKLGCSTIILAGQNFAFKNNQYYTKGVNYSFRSNELSQSEAEENKDYVEDVYGNQVQTMHGHTFSRLQMESYLSVMTDIEVINTTRGGAKIAGTQFMHLDQVMSEKLTVSVVDPDWYQAGKTSYDLDKLYKNTLNIEESNEELNSIYTEIIKTLRKMDLLANYNEHNQLKKMFPKFDKQFKSMFANTFFDVYIKPMTRSRYEHVTKLSSTIRQSTDMVEKVRLTMDTFGPYLYECQQVINKIRPSFESLHRFIYFIVNEAKGEATKDGNQADSVLAE